MSVLHVAYYWLILGCLLMGGALSGYVSHSAAVHAWTVGAIGGFTLGMMARVALGHTGRSIRVSRLTVVAFAMLNLAAVARVLLPLALPAYYPFWVQLAGVLWVLAFGLGALVYAPVLLRPRVDGKPG